MSISLLSKSTGTNLDRVFAPFVSGSSPPATGLLDDSGVDIATRYAPIVDGTQATATGMLDQNTGADINTLFAAYGSTSYPLPFNGQSYTAANNLMAGDKGSAGIGFEIIGGNTWTIYSFYSGTNPPSGIALASGSIPSGYINVEYAWVSSSTPSGSYLATGTNTNDATSQVAVSSNPVATYNTISYSSIAGSSGTRWVFTVAFYNASGIAVSNNTVYLTAEVEGSI